MGLPKSGDASWRFSGYVAQVRAVLVRSERTYAFETVVDNVNGDDASRTVSYGFGELDALVPAYA
jgi:hypothetical protein